MKFDNLEPVAAAAAPDIVGCGEYDAAGSVVVVGAAAVGAGDAWARMPPGCCMD